MRNPRGEPHAAADRGIRAGRADRRRRRLRRRDFCLPVHFLADIVGTDTVDTAARREVARGEFIHVNPSDPIHYGQGHVTVYDDLVHLQDDFEVGPGPAFHVYLVPKADVRDEANVEGSMYVDLGRLRAFKGSQNYPIPAGVELGDYGSVVIWCERFGVLISPATLESIS